MVRKLTSLIAIALLILFTVTIEAQNWTLLTNDNTLSTFGVTPVGIRNRLSAKAFVTTDPKNITFFLLSGYPKGEITALSTFSALNMEDMNTTNAYSNAWAWTDITSMVSNNPTTSAHIVESATFTYLDNIGNSWMVVVGGKSGYTSPGMATINAMNLSTSSLKLMFGNKCNHDLDQYRHLWILLCSIWIDQRGSDKHCCSIWWT